MANTNSSSWTDDLLLREIRAGGRRRNTAWEYIYKAWRGYYLAPALHQGGTPGQVDEVLGLVVVDMEKQLLKPDFELQTTTLRGYFTECVRRAWTRAREQAGRRATGELDPHTYDAGQRDSVEQDYIQHEKLVRLDALLTQLGEQCKTVLTLFIRGYSMREIAETMGFTNEQSAKNVKSRCHQKLLELTDNL